MHSSAIDEKCERERICSICCEEQAIRCSGDSTGFEPAKQLYLFLILSLVLFSHDDVLRRSHQLLAIASQPVLEAQSH